MPMIWNSTQILRSARRICRVGKTSSTGSADSDVLEMVNEALMSQVYPELLKIREEYFVRGSRLALSSSQSRYRIHSRAFGNKLREIYWTDGTGVRNRLMSVNPDQLHRYNAANTAGPSGFYIEGDYIVLTPSIATNAVGELEQVFFLRPSTLVLVSATRALIAVNSTTKVITSATPFPTSWAVGNLIDIHSYKSGAELKVYDVTIAAITTVVPYTITITEAIDGSTYGTYTPEVGDYVALANECAIPALPQEVQPILVDAAAAAMVLAEEDQEAVEMHRAQFTAKLTSMKQALEVRVEGKPPRLQGKRGLLRAGRIWTS